MKNESPLANQELDPEQWVQKYLRLNNIQYNYKTDSFVLDGSTLDFNLLLSKLRLAAYQCRVLHIKPLLPDAINVLKKQCTVDFLNNLRKSLISQPTEQDLVAEFVQACTGKVDSIDLAVMKHWVWQIKRKIFGLPVGNHMMLILCGASGGGKSVACHAFLKPIEAVSVCRDMTVFNDQFSRNAFTRFYCMFMDELSKVDDVDINCLKNVLTAPTLDFRSIHSEANNSGPQNCTFLGCSNTPLKDQIKDPTSSRRFYQLDCDEKLDWNTINSLDYFALWRSMDENSPSPIDCCLQEVRERQESQRQKDSVELFLSEMEPTGTLKAMDAYRSYGQFLEQQNLKSEQLSVTKFSFRLLELGIRKYRTANGVMYSFDHPSKTNVA